MSIILTDFLSVRCRSQGVRQGSAKPPCVGAIPTGTSNTHLCHWSLSRAESKDPVCHFYPLYVASGTGSLNRTELMIRMISFSSVSLIETGVSAVKVYPIPAATAES